MNFPVSKILVKATKNMNPITFERYSNASFIPIISDDNGD